MIAGIILYMRPILSLESASALDHSIISRCRLSESTLIDNAASCAFSLTKDLVHGRVLVMVGPGNNGSDGLALALLLHSAGFSPDVFFLYEKGNPENMRRRKLLPEDISVTDTTAVYDTVFDALFGFSFHCDADDRTQRAAEGANKAETVISLDVPSAFIVEADVTVSFMVPKDILYEPLFRWKAGIIMIANPGFPESELEAVSSSLFLLSDADSAMRRFSVSDYKNSRGHIAIIGGSDRYTGAPRLASRAAFFSGAGLVTIATGSEKIRDENPAVIIAGTDTDFSSYASLAIGPGWGDGDEKVFERAVESGRSIVVDADALRFVPTHRFSYRAVLTPHIGEYRRLMASLSIPDGLGNPETLSSALLSLSLLTESVVVLKSSVVWIACKDRIYIYDGANPSLGVAGSGDVLCGIIAALLGEGEDALQAAVDGVILHQRAGRKAHEEFGFYSAEELIQMVGRCR